MTRWRISVGMAAASVFAAIISIGAQGLSRNGETGRPPGGEPGPRKWPAIKSAVVSLDQTTLFVEGENFGRNPWVWLDGVPLGGVEVANGGRRLTALMPVLVPGSYKLAVMTTGRQTDGRNRRAGPISPLAGLALKGNEE